MNRAPFFEEHVPKALVDLHHGKENFDEAELMAFCDFVDQREDCNDFRMVALQRLYLQYHDSLSDKAKKRMKGSILGFRYWMSEPGTDNMCFWSENHQLLFAAAEYIGASIFKDSLFENDGKIGDEKSPFAVRRIRHWLDQRFRTGFIEWHSHVYYAEDLAGLMHLIDFSEDEDIRKKAIIITDLLFLDMAMHSFKGYFNLTHGRSYEKQKKHPAKADVAPILSDAFGLTDIPYDWTHIASMYAYRQRYQLPDIIKKIAADDSDVIIKDSMGYDLKRIHDELDLNEPLDRNVLWQMEAFTNPEIISHTVDMLNDHQMYDNAFLSDFKSISHPLLRKLGLLPLISRILHPVTDGVAIQKANTYTYKTKHYSLSTAQMHHPGECGDQQHIMNACFGGDVNVFLTHPAKHPYDEENAYLSLSPNAWVGNGRMPSSAQDENINLSMYVIPGRKAFMEKELHFYTHAYFPTEAFTEWDILDRYAFMRFHKGMLAIIAKSTLEFKNKDELIQKGKRTGWVFETSSTDEETYDAFKTRIRNNKIHFGRKDITYESKKKIYHLIHKKRFMIDGKEVQLDYPRFDTPYIKMKRHDLTANATYENQQIYWDFQSSIRKEDHHG